MKKSHRNFKLFMPSLTDDNKIINGISQSISLHDVETQYQILSINNFNRCNNIGFFNKKTDFRIGEEKSIIILDKNLKSLDIKTSEINSTYDDPQYLVYPIPSFYLDKNDYFIFNEVSKQTTVELTFEFGEILIKMIQLLASEPTYRFDYNNNTFDSYGYPPQLFKLLISCNQYGYSINKNLIINSNPDFLLGLLNGLESNIFINLNIYTITTILNYLGAMYSITRGKNDSRVLNFKLPQVFQFHEKLKNSKIDFKNDKKHIERIMSKFDVNLKDSIMGTELWKDIVFGKIALIKADDLQFIKMEDKIPMYDFTMQRADATNFAIPFGPILKNSDGDILGVIGIFGQESLEEAQEFSPETKDYFKSFNDGEIQSWITKDAVLGLYNVTKMLKK